MRQRSVATQEVENYAMPQPIKPPNLLALQNPKHTGSSFWNTHIARNSIAGLEK